VIEIDSTVSFFLFEEVIGLFANHFMESIINLDFPVNHKKNMFLDIANNIQTIEILFILSVNRVILMNE
jgi:hypothetical protein